MQRFTVTTEIAAPVERVWRIMVDVERWSEWTKSITSVRRLDQGAFAAGSRALVRQPKLPPALWKVTSTRPGRSFTWISVAPGLRVTGRHAVEHTRGGTRATLTIEMEGMFAAFWARVTRRLTERYLGYEAAGLKARSEAA